MPDEPTVVLVAVLTVDDNIMGFSDVEGDVDDSTDVLSVTDILGTLVVDEFLGKELLLGCGSLLAGIVGLTVVVLLVLSKYICGFAV